MEFRAPENDDEIRWIARRYEEIGAASIPGYAVTDETLEDAERFVRSQLVDESWRVLVADDDGTLAAFLLCHVRNSPMDASRECSVDALHVEPDHRRRGLGRRLLEEAEAWGRAKGARRIRTYVACTNDPMHALCTGAGLRATFVELARPLREETTSPGTGRGARARRGKR